MLKNSKIYHKNHLIFSRKNNDNELKMDLVENNTTCLDDFLSEKYNLDKLINWQNINNSIE